MIRGTVDVVARFGFLSRERTLFIRCWEKARLP